MSAIVSFLGDVLDWLLLAVGAALVLVGATSKAWGAVNPVLALVRGPVAVLCRWAGVALCIYAGGSLWLRQHDAGLLAAREAQEQAAVSAAREQEHAAAVAALDAAQRDADARVRAVSMVKERIAHAPVLVGCASSPAIAAALDGLRDQPAGHPGAASGSSGVAAILRARAGPAGAGQH
jgi:hypothetical protein